MIFEMLKERPVLKLKAVFLLMFFLLLSCTKEGGPNPFRLEPVKIKVVHHDSLTVNLAWTKYRKEYDFKKYVLERAPLGEWDVRCMAETESTPPDFAWVEIAEIEDVDDTSFLDTTVSPGYLYAYRIILLAGVSRPTGTRVFTMTNRLSAFSLRFEPRVTWMGLGESAMVRIYIENVQDLMSFTLEVDYDTSIVKLQSVEPGELFLNYEQFNFSDTGGKLWVQASLRQDREGISGSGEILRFDVKGVGKGDSPLHFNPSALLFKDILGNVLEPPNIINGGVVVR